MMRCYNVDIDFLRKKIPSNDTALGIDLNVNTVICSFLDKNRTLDVPDGHGMLTESSLS